MLPYPGFRWSCCHWLFTQLLSQPDSASRDCQFREMPRGLYPYIRFVSRAQLGAISLAMVAPLTSRAAATLWAAGLFEARLQFHYPLLQCSDLSFALCLSGGGGAQKFRHQVHRGRNGRLDCAQAVLYDILDLLVRVEGGLEIPHDKLL